MPPIELLTEKYKNQKRVTGSGPFMQVKFSFAAFPVITEKGLHFVCAGVLGSPPKTSKYRPFSRGGGKNPMPTLKIP